MITRNLEKQLKYFIKKYPIVTITGPRQSGKTTLCKMTLPKYKYVSLEDPDIRQHAINDPRSFLERFNNKVIFDEIQRVPELTSYIQTIVDKENKEGMFILIGSHNFSLIESISQSLSGRTALLTLLPFSYDEIYNHTYKKINTILTSGFYPRIFDKNLKPEEFYPFYIQTYIERDMRNIIAVKDLNKFQQFIRLCAANTGQIVNLSKFGNECSINHNTAKAWLGLLEASYIITLIKPYYKNYKKRIIKSPKLYFNDVGLASYLLGIKNEKQVDIHPLKGALFETFIISEFIKQNFHFVKNIDLYFFRDNIGNEVDLIIDMGNFISIVEIKSGKTITKDFFKGINYFKRIVPDIIINKTALIYGGEDEYVHKGVHILPYNKVYINKL